MKPGLTISCVAHAGVLLWGLVAFAARPSEAPPAEALPVEFVSATDFSQLTAGVKNAKPVEKPKPLVDKLGDPKPVDKLAPKVADKPEVTTDSAAPEPKPEPKLETKPETKPAETAEKPKAEPKPEPKPETKPEPKPEPKPQQAAEQPKQPETKLDQLAQEVKKEEAKKPPKPAKKPPEFKPDQIADELKKDEARKPAEDRPRKDVRQTPKFDANEVAALLDKREPQRQIAAGETLNTAASLGAANGHAAQLSQSELDALRARLSQCWSPPAGIDARSKLYVVLHVVFKPDGSVAHEPEVVEDPGSALGSALTESAKRALLLCQPFTMLRPEHYDQWKDIEVKFDPQELLGG